MKNDQMLRRIDSQINDLLDRYLGENRENFDEIKEKILMIAEDAKNSAEKSFREVDTYVSENYWKSIAIAAAVGLLSGIIIAKK